MEEWAGQSLHLAAFLLVPFYLAVLVRWALYKMAHALRGRNGKVVHLMDYWLGAVGIHHAREYSSRAVTLDGGLKVNDLPSSLEWHVSEAMTRGSLNVVIDAIASYLERRAQELEKEFRANDYSNNLRRNAALLRHINEEVEV